MKYKYIYIVALISLDCHKSVSLIQDAQTESIDAQTDIENIDAQSDFETDLEDINIQTDAKDKPIYPPILSEYTTLFDNNLDNRMVNISTAASELNGYVIEPNKIFSFNDVVGIRSIKNGYKKAPVLLEGRRTDDLGGGVCQVSSTLHAAALLGQLKIIERRPHSLVPKYIEPGYDATVAFPASCEDPKQPCEKLDLKIKNTYNVPIIIYTKIDHGTEDTDRLTIRLDGYSTENCMVQANHNNEQLNRGVRRMVRSGKILSANYVKVLQQAAPGLMVWSNIIWRCEGKPDNEVKWFSRYPPVDEIWEVGYARPFDAGTPWKSE